MGEVLSTRHVKKARKQHSCWWCGETIEVGESYFNWTWQEGRALTRVKVHPECKVAWQNAGDDYECIEAEHERGK